MKEWIIKIENRWILLGGIIAIVGVSTPFFIMRVSNKPFKLSSFERLGTVGDFFGGTTVGFLSLASMFFVIAAIVMQKEELRLQREELKDTRAELKKSNEQYEITNQTMKIQQFETTFFNMINMHSNLINDLKDLKKNNSGRGVIVEFYKTVYEKFTTEGYHAFLTDYLYDFESSDNWYDFYSEFVNSTNQLLFPQGRREIEMYSKSEFERLLSNLKSENRKKTDAYGRHFIEIIYQCKFEEMKNYTSINQLHEFSNDFENLFLKNKYKKIAFDSTNRELNFCLSNYIKSIKSIILFVDESNFEKAIKNKYLNIFFSQFTIHEISVINYFIELGEELDLKRYFLDYESLNTKDKLSDSIV